MISMRGEIGSIFEFFKRQGIPVRAITFSSSNRCSLLAKLTTPEPLPYNTQRGINGHRTGKKEPHTLRPQVREQNLKLFLTRAGHWQS